MKQKLFLFILLMAIMSMAKSQNIGAYVNSRDSLGSVAKPTAPDDSKLLIIPSDAPEGSNSYSVSLNYLKDYVGSKLDTASFGGSGGSGGSGGGGGGVVYQQVKVTLSSTDILNLHTTPVVIVPAQGANTIVKILTISSVYNYGTLQYTSPGFPAGSMRYTGSGINEPVSSLNQVTGTISYFKSNEEVDMEGELSLASNNSVEIFNSADQFLSGDGTVDLYVVYQVLDLN